MSVAVVFVFVCVCVWADLTKHGWSLPCDFELPRGPTDRLRQIAESLRMT